MAWCPICKCEYKEGITKCADCNVELVDVLEENMAGIGRVIRGIGCIWGIDVGTGVRSKAVIRECFDRGLILERAGRDDSVVKIMPSLVIEKELLIQGLQILKESMDTVLKE